MRERKEKRVSGKITAVAGLSQSGKTTKIREEIKGAQRLIVWDVREEYPANDDTIECIRTRRQLIEALSSSDPGRYAYVGKGLKLKEEFHFWCLAAYHWGKLWPASIVADELSDVTNSGKAPDAWGQLVRKGRFYGNWLYGITQSPTESDKTLWTNANVKRSFVFEGDNEREYMARRLSVTPEDIPTEYYKGIQTEVGKLGFTHI